MSYDAYVRLRQGSLKPVYADINAGAGNTATIQPGGTFTLYNSDGLTVLGLVAVALSGYNPTAVQEPNAWFVLNTAPLAPGVYMGILSFDAIGSDGITRQFDVDIQIEILAPVAIDVSYSDALLGITPLYQARLYASDADPANAIFSDNEYLYFLTKYAQIPELAAADALDVMAVDEAKLSNAVRIGTYGNGKVETYKAIVERAAHLRAIAPVAPLVACTVDVFTLGSRRFSGDGVGGYAGDGVDWRPGSMDDW